MKRHRIMLALFALTVFTVAAREPQTDMGIRQHDDATMKWWQDAKFGMFIHWGLYAVPAKGEWYMENAAIPIDAYRQYAFDQGNGIYFDARDFHPKEWARIAKDAGMKYMCLTARHHDGFALFDSHFTNAFTSVQTLHRDLVGEFYGTSGGPWNPVDGQYGFTSKPGKIFVHLLPGFGGTEFTTPPVAQKVTDCVDCFTKMPVAWKQASDGSVHITEIDRQSHPADTVICLRVTDK